MTEDKKEEVSLSPQTLITKKRDKMTKEFVDIKKSVKNLVGRIHELDTSIKRQYTHIDVYEDIEQTLNEEIAVIKDWKENNKSPKELQSTLQKKENTFKELVEKLQKIQNSCESKTQELENILQSFLE